MNFTNLKQTARSLLRDGHGLLAMDESTGTCNRRFAAVGIPQTEAARRDYREMIVTAPNLGHSISGAILFEETIRQTLRNGKPFVDALREAGIIPGIKLDLGAKDLPGFAGEKITAGLDGLVERVQTFRDMGTTFAKWRAVISIGSGLPTDESIEANAHVLARYAAICQEGGLVPIVEPEVLMDGDHNLQRCFEVTERVLRAVFRQLAAYRVSLEGMLLKPNMVLPGVDCTQQESFEAVADATIMCLMRTVPAAVSGIAFLSGGQSGELASARLNAMNVRFAGRLPWVVTFSYSRAIQQKALEIWSGSDANVERAQRELIQRAECNRAARLGQYDAAMESAAAES